MLFRPSNLTLVTTHRCTAACDNCCFSCNPAVTDAIPLDRLRSLIDETQDLPSVKKLAFTGGECFLLGKHLDELILRASSHGLWTKCISNGYWAVTRSAAERRIADLRESGLDELALSTGTFHEEYVPLGRVVEGARAAARAGLRVQIVVETCDQSTFGPAYVASLPEIADLVASRQILIIEDPWIPNVRRDGRHQLTHRCVSPAAKDAAKEPCFPMEAIPELALGSVATTSMRDVIAAAEDNLLMMWLRVDGPYKMLELVNRLEPSYTMPEGHVSICQTCHFLHRDVFALRVLRDHAVEVQERIVRMHLASEVLKAGGRLKPP
jgi:MoaA/NifB/PqqE/SkfB family radical SAM enzyme